jgi:hypothetical protein
MLPRHHLLHMGLVRRDKFKCLMGSSLRITSHKHILKVRMGSILQDLKGTQIARFW